jgi:hypothetical protein
MTTKTLRTAMLVTTALALVPIEAHATLARAVSFDEKVENAAAIVLGRVVSKEARWDASRRWILTYSRFEVAETLKGFPAREITIVTPGGTVGNIQQETVGVPKLREGDEHVVFIKNSQAGPTVLYFDQGAYRVVKDDRGEKLVEPSTSAAVYIDTQAGKAVSAEPPRSLRAFQNEVRDTMRKREAMRMDMMERQKKEETSIWRVVERNKALILLALVGAALATWQLVKRW